MIVPQEMIRKIEMNPSQAGRHPNNIGASTESCLFSAAY